jgi:transglutaminase-like putative cysteine protease
MREANWDEVFQKRREDVPDETRLSSIVPWEGWLTFAITALLFLSCVWSIQGAGWVDDMPSLYPVGFAGLITGYGLSRVSKMPALLLHALAMFVGAALVYFQLLAILPGGSIEARTDELLDRMYVWWSAATQNGISNDGLPVIVVMLVLTWIGAYVSAWAIFRWRNPWLGLVPSGLALMWNISFIPGQFSYAFVVYCFAAVLLVMRLHVEQKQTEWDRERIVYPEFMSLSVLHATFWVAVGLLVLVWMMPLAHRSETAQERWNDFTAPITRHLTPYARVFVGVNAKKPIAVHNIKDALPFQGKITLNTKEALEIEVELTPEMAQFLREQSFDEYTAAGWKINVNAVPLPAGERTDVLPADAADGSRQEVTINITVKGGNDEHLFSVGQPVTADEAADARVGTDEADVSSLEPDANLSNGDTYTVTGSVAVPSIEQLAAADSIPLDAYPGWVKDRYLEVPADVPARVRFKAEEVAAGATTPFEKSLAIETYLRTFSVDYSVPVTPHGRDTVDYFLFDLQRGYFDYHASAMAVMLRTLGVPARVATGYVIDPQAQLGGEGSYKLTQKNAYAWPEVYFPGIGWVEFSPSPDQPRIMRRTDAPLVAPSAGADPNDRGLGDEVIFGDPQPTGPLSASGAADGGGSSDGLALLIAVGMIVVLIAVVAGAGRFAWEFGMSGLSRPAQLWEKTVRLATLGNARPSVSETPREFAARLRREVPGTDAAGYVAAKYEGARFGQKAISEDEAEKLESAWSSLRAALLRRALRLKGKG